MNWKDILFSRRNKGFVLVSVLMLGVMLISCATAFSWFVRQQVRGLGRERALITSRSMAQVLASSMMNVLYEISVQINYDSPTQRWFQPFIVPVGDSEIWVVQVTPLDDKIPLRNLFLPDGNTLRREFSDLWHDMLDRINAASLEQILLDFFDRNTRPRVGSVELENFINRGPYDMSELLILSGDVNHDLVYGNGIQRGFADYCTVYSDGQINLNVAPVHVMELLPGLDTGGLAARIAQVRTETPLRSLRDVQNIPGASPKTSTLLTNIAGFKSRYFMMNIQSLTEDGESGITFSIVFDRTTRRIVRWEES